MSLYNNICIVGGSGFVGRQITEQLSAAGRQVTVVTRRRERHRDLLVLPGVQVVECDVYNLDALQGLFAGHDAVINLVGILNERGRRGQGFERTHVTLPDRVVQACRHAGVLRLLHMSALQADPSGPSEYLRSKGRGEALVRAADGRDLHVTIFQPSVIFGPGDRFTNRFVHLLRSLPFVFPLACPHARLQPVSVGDVADAFVSALDQHASFGQVYALCGPRAYTLQEIVEYLARVSEARRCILGLPAGLSWLQAAVMEHLPGKPFTRDNYRSLGIDSVCEGDAARRILGRTPVSMEEDVPRYLGDTRSERYSALRAGGAPLPR
jgi:NADH dehydrogenase